MSRIHRGEGGSQVPDGLEIVASLTVPVEPVPKGRPRVSPAEYTVIGGRQVKTRSAHAYTPQRTSDFEDAIGWSLRAAKALLDACNGIAYADDRQVVQLLVDMVPAQGQPKVQFTIYVLPEIGAR